MGWLQGARFRSVQQLQREGRSKLVQSEFSVGNKPEATHIEDVTMHIATENRHPISEPSVGTSPNAHPPCSHNEVEDLLEATFGQRKHSSMQPASSCRTQSSLRESRGTSWPTDRALQEESLADQALPVVSKDEIMSKKLTVNENGLVDESHVNGLWIVVDDIVYDCSTFINDHPGGKQVILSFVGEDCSWQFWRFHGKNDLERYGRPLRIGRTKGVFNRHEERPKYIGLQGHSRDEW